MTIFEHVLVQARSGLADINAERDAARHFEARYGGSPALDTYLREREVERAHHLLVIDGLQLLHDQGHPALRYHVRATRMLKMSLRPALPLATTGTDR